RLIASCLLLIVIFLLFCFSLRPIAGVPDRLLALLARVRGQAGFTGSDRPFKTRGGATPGTGPFPYGVNGNGSPDVEAEGARPFHFIREDQLNKLPLLFKGMSPAQCALVLAYLPAGWASKVLRVLDQGVQNTIMRELSQ